MVGSGRVGSVHSSSNRSKPAPNQTKFDCGTKPRLRFGHGVTCALLCSRPRPSARLRRRCARIAARGTMRMCAHAMQCQCHAALTRTIMLYIVLPHSIGSLQTTHCLACNKCGSLEESLLSGYCTRWVLTVYCGRSTVRRALSYALRSIAGNYS